MFVAAALIARHNVRKGRGDRRGAIQLASFVSLAAVGVWLLDARHYADPSLEMTRFFVGQPLWHEARLIVDTRNVVPLETSAHVTRI